ncbi:MAG: tRNA pseudouridine(55) synthase TruB [bacterium]
MNGVLIIDKPADITSHDVVEQVRRVTGIKKIGHGGTLDPFATGVLLILVGSTTRLMEYINMMSKTYAAEITLGATSDTDDITGEILKSKTRAGKTPEARAALVSFLGRQQQTPPSYSAIKVKGQKAYQAARKGTPLKLKPRVVNIYNIQLIDYQYPVLSLTVTCSSGTYIRALARDIGEKLKTGAYLSKLCRTSIELSLTKPNKNMKQKFTLENAVKLDQLTASNLTSHLLPPSTLVAHLPLIILSQSNVAQLRNGQKIEWGSTNLTWSPEQPIALFTKDNQLIGIGHFDPATRLLSPKKIL